MEPTPQPTPPMPPGVQPVNTNPVLTPQPVGPVSEPVVAQSGLDVPSGSSKWNALEIGAGVALGVAFC